MTANEVEVLKSILKAIHNRDYPYHETGRAINGLIDVIYTLLSKIEVTDG